MGGSKKKRKPAMIRAGRVKQRPSQYGTFAFVSYDWGFQMDITLPRMKAGRVIREATPPGASGVISEALKAKAMASIGATIQMPSLLVTRTEAIRKVII